MAVPIPIPITIPSPISIPSPIAIHSHTHSHTHTYIPHFKPHLLHDIAPSYDVVVRGYNQRSCNDAV